MSAESPEVFHARSSFYQRLGVHRSSNATEIKEAWRKLSRKTHPDANVTEQTELEQSVQTALFAALSEAYAVLKVPASRKAYDRLLDLTGDECGTCKGKGYNAKNKSFTVRISTPCEECLRTGRILRKNCPQPEKEARK